MEPESFSFSTLQNSNIYPLCPNCLKLPYITIKGEVVEIKCTCGINKIYKANEYIKFLFQNPKVNKCHHHKKENAISYCFNCKKWLCISCLVGHDNFTENHKKTNKRDSIVSECSTHKKFKEFYCLTCLDYLCTECKGSHNSNHLCKNVLSMTQEIKINELYNKLKHASNHVEEYYSKIKDNEIKKITNEYIKCKERNSNILKIIRILLNVFIPNEPNNYNLIQNISNISFKIKKLTFNENIINYYQNNYIIQYKPYYFDIEKSKEIATLKQQNTPICSLLVLQDGRLASCSSDKIINIYNPINKFNLDISIDTQHNKSILSICQLSTNTIISSSLDKSIKFWNIDNNSYQCLHTITDAHQEFISKVIALPDSKIASCSKDKTIKLWDIKRNYECYHTFNAHKNIVSSILLMSNIKTLISGSFDHCLGIWDINEKKNINMIKRVFCGWNNSLIEMDNCRVVVGRYDRIQIVNVESFEIEKVIISDLFEDISCLLLLKDGNVLCGCEDGSICKYTIFNERVDKREIYDSDIIRSMVLLIEENIAFCGGKIKIWQ